MKKVIFFILIMVVASSFTTINEDVIAVLRNRLSIINRQFERAKIDLFFNQSKYAPGDTALIRTRYLLANDLSPIQGRELVYLELYDQSGKRVLRNQFAVVNGASSNQWIIPATITPGIYLLVSYTEWMRNMDPLLFFRQEMTIADVKAIAHEELVGLTPGIEFYPEGGTFVQGIENNVVVHVTANSKNAAVNIKNGSGQVATAMVDGNGLAEVKITPSAGEVLVAELKDLKFAASANLPAAQSSGFSIQVVPGSEGLQVSVQSAAIDLTSQRFYLILCNNQQVLYNLQLTKNEKITITLPATLPVGVAQLTIIDEKLKVYSNRAIFVKPKANYQVKINSKSTYATREAVTLDFNVSDNLGNPPKGNFSARITNTSLFGDSTDNSMYANHLLLYSDLSSTFKMKQSPNDQELLRYLSTQTCPWLNWEKVLADRKLPQYVALANQTISGTVVMAATGKPVPDSTQVMFFIQKQLIGYERLIVDNGKFSFPLLFDFNGTDQIFFTASRKGRDINDIAVRLDKDSGQYSFKPRPIVKINKDDSYGHFNFQKRLIDNSFTFFSRKAVKDSVDDKNVLIEKELQGADVVFKTSDFLIFPTMEELIREVLKGVDYRKMKGKDVIRVYTTNKLPTSYATPLYVIDGVMTKDVHAFLSLVPAEIATIKIIKTSQKLLRFGILGANGIILVRTTNNQAAENIKPENVFPVTGMNIGTGGENLSYLKRDSQTPDLRPCLNFTPNGILDDTGRGIIKFRTSDDTGTFKVHIEGVTALGIPFSGDEIVTVRYNQQ